MANLEHEISEECKKKKSQGKRKIEIKLIGKKTSRQVTFSKRRCGLFKKASELCALCGAEVAIIAFSGAGKLFSFGHPSADSVILRYLNSSSSSTEEGQKVITHVGAENVSMSSCIGSGFWWDEPIDENLGLDGLEQLKIALEGLRNRVVSRLYEINSSFMGGDGYDQQIVNYDWEGSSSQPQTACDYTWTLMGRTFDHHA